MLVLIVGATGVLGRETVRRLRAADYRVRGMTRDVRRMRDLESLGAEPVIGDLTNRASLVRACADVDRVFAAAHGALGRGRNRSEAVDDVGHRSLIDVARDAGVTRFVYTSALGAAPDQPIDFFRTKWAIEQYLASSGLEYVVLRPAALMEWHAHTFNGKGILDKGRTVILGTGTKRRNFVAASDVAATAAEALTGAPPRERVITIGGHGDFTNDEVARLYAQIAGVPARIVHVPRAALSAIGAIARPFHPGIARVMRLSSLPDDAFPETLDADDSAGDRAIGSTSLEAFVRERVLEHRGAPLNGRYSQLDGLCERQERACRCDQLVAANERCAEKPRSFHRGIAFDDGMSGAAVALRREAFILGQGEPVPASGDGDDRLVEGDGGASEGETRLDITGKVDGSELLLFDRGY